MTDTVECAVTPITGRLVRPPADPIVYIAGPMRDIEDHNFPAFDDARDYLNEIGGYTVISPADIDREEGDTPESLSITPEFFQLCMKRDLEIVARAHAILLLEGWEKSTGANNELFVANACGIEVWIALYENGKISGHWVSPSAVVPPLLFNDVYSDGFVSWQQNSNGTWETAKEAEPQSILAEADGLIFGPRQDMYGHPVDDFSRTGRMWGAILGIPDVPPEKVGLCMVAVKISREVNRPKRDNRVDMAGYAGCVDRIAERLDLDQ